MRALLLALIAGPTADPAELRVDADFPGGNIVVERIDGGEIWLRQDRRDTDGFWFYWCCRVVGAAGRAVTFHFTDGVVTTIHGPAVSYDGGATWDWLGGEAHLGDGFRLSVPNGCQELRLAMTIPYTEADLARYLARSGVRREELCRSRAGRSVPLLRIGCHDNEPEYRVLLTARHHCCETIPSFVLEGLIDFVLGDDADATWLRERVAFYIIPFVDADGVEAGDQGKNRRPRDHNRDYDGESLYAETAALRRLAPVWAPDGWSAMLDLHCPYLRGDWDHRIFVVGSPYDAIATQQRRFAQALEAACRGPLPFRAEDFLPYGQAWNTPANFGQGTSACRWAAGQPGTRLASTIEIPYSEVRGQRTSPDAARAFGADLARALRRYLAAP